MDTSELVRLLSPVSFKHSVSPTLAYEIYKDVKMILEEAPKATRYWLIGYATNTAMFNTALIQTNGMLNKKGFESQLMSRHPLYKSVMITFLYEFKSEQEFKDFEQ